MNFLPVVTREISSLARSRGTYLARARAALLGIGLTASVAIAFDFGAAPPGFSKGQAIFIALSFLYLAYSLLVGVRSTSDCLSEERREGTLGLLFLTPLKSWHILLGKLISSSLNACYCLAGLIPLLALVVMFGGVTSGQIIRIVASLFNAVFFSLSAGLLVSSFSRDSRRAMFATFGLLFIATLGPLVLTFWINTQFARFVRNDFDFLNVLSPAYAFVKSGILGMGTYDPRLFAYSLAVPHLIGWFFIAQGCFALIRVWKNEGQPKARKWMKKVTPKVLIEKSRSERQSRYRHRSLDRNPYLWMLARNPWKRYAGWLFLVCMIAIAIWVYARARIAFPETVIVLLYLSAVFFKLWLTAEVVVRMFDERKSGSFELLLASPLKLRTLSKGVNWGLWRLLGPPAAFLLISGLVLYLFEDIWNDRNFNANRPSDFVQAFWPVTILFVLDLIALKWLGMWTALKSSSSGRAFCDVVGLVLLVPWFISLAGMALLALVHHFLWPINPDDQMFLWIWTGASLAVNAACVAQGRYNFHHRLRTLASYGFDYKSARREWIEKPVKRSPQETPKARRIPWPRTWLWRFACALLFLMTSLIVGMLIRRDALSDRIEKELKASNLVLREVKGETLQRASIFFNPELELDSRILEMMEETTHFHQIPGVNHSSLSARNWDKTDGAFASDKRLADLTLVLKANERALGLMDRYLADPNGGGQSMGVVNVSNYGRLYDLSRLPPLDFLYHSLNGEDEKAFQALVRSWDWMTRLNVLVPPQYWFLRRLGFEENFKAFTLFVNSGRATREQLNRIKSLVDQLRPLDYENAADANAKETALFYANPELMSLVIDPSKRDEWAVRFAINRITLSHEREFLFYLETLKKFRRELPNLPTRMDGYFKLRDFTIDGLPALRNLSLISEQTLDLFQTTERLLDDEILRSFLRIILAVEFWRLDHGKLPESLEALTPNYLIATPKDPYSPGSPILYETHERSYTLESKGLHYRGADIQNGRATVIELMKPQLKVEMNPSP